MSKRSLSLALILVLLTLTGCWNRIEPEQYAWLTWVGLDTAAGGKIQVTVAVSPPLSPVPTGAAQPEKLLLYSSATGDTLFEAVREINAHLPKRLFWSYLEAVFISEDLARAGVEQHLDALFRNVRVRKNAWVFITKGPTSPLFQINPQIEKNPMDLIDSLVRAEAGFLGNSRVIRLKDLHREMFDPGLDPVVSVLRIWDQKQKELIPPGAEVPKESELALNGSAVLRGDKLVGWLTPDESQVYLLAKGEMKTGLIVVPHPDNPNNRVGIEVIRGNAKLKPQISGDQVKAKITINVKGKLGDQVFYEPGRALETPNEDPTFYRQLGEALEQKIKSEVEELLTKSQTEFNADILGVGERLMYRYPKDWEQVKSEWRELYKEAVLEVEVKVNITSSNIMHSRVPHDDED
ncbi:Ger(x)C family spore germination protein [Paradesulfitobacterium aromaticivorans]